MSAAEFPPGIGPPEAAETHENGHVPASDNGAGASHLDWLRARHEAITADRTVDLPVPGYDGRLVLRFGRVPWNVTRRIQALLTTEDRDGRGLLVANVDVLIASCREVLGRDDAGDLVSIDPAGEPVRIEPRLAALFGLPPETTARETLLWLFGAGNEFAVATMAGEVVEWTRTGDAEVRDDLMGESAPAVK